MQSNPGQAAVQCIKCRLENQIGCFVPQQWLLCTCAWLPVLHLACLLCVPGICEPIPHACRLYVIHRCKKLKQLDFRKVKQKEREEAAKVIGAAQQPADAAADEKATTFEPDEDLAQAEAATAAAQQQVRTLLCDDPCLCLLPLISHAVVLTHCLTLLVLHGCQVTCWQPAATPSVNSQRPT